LKTENEMGGRYFAELLLELFEKLESMQPNTAAEYRLSIYGTSV
jgi:hypothetical protein